jgi:hypothetical protein
MIDAGTRAALGGKMRDMTAAHGEYHRARRETRLAAWGGAVVAALAALVAAIGGGGTLTRYACVGGLLALDALAYARALTRLASARRRLAALMADAQAGLRDGRGRTAHP